MTPITFWFDPISPYAHLAFERLPQALEGCSYVVDYRPVLFAGLLKQWGQLGPAEIGPKRDWTYRQVVWLAHRHGIDLQLPAVHPFNRCPCCACWSPAVGVGWRTAISARRCCAMCGPVARRSTSPGGSRASRRGCSRRATRAPTP
ncbi:DSBA-like thioredoxin domain protein [Methylibium sp. T29-B]|nr:DSBA-like thioredoxin domain protein [Methylibium sp. T29-B]